MADHLTTALLLRREGVAWTSLRDRKGRPEVAGQCAAALDLPPGVTELTDAEAAAQVKARCGGVRGRMTVSLPTAQALLRVLRLPTDDASEIAGMVELQVDKFAPFPLEQMVISWEVLDRQEGTTRVLVAAAPRASVQKLGDACEKAGLSPTEVDVDIMGWWRLLRDAGELADAGRQLLLILEETGSELILLQDGVPLVFRAVGLQRAAAPAEAAEEIAEELQYTLTTLEAEWGARDAGPIHVWHAAAFGSDFLAALGGACGRPVQTHALANLPPLSEGLARRAMDRPGELLDLAPPDWKTASAQRRARANILIAVAAVIGVWLLAAAAFLELLQFRVSALNKVKAEARQLAGPSTAVKQLQGQLQALERYSDRTYSGIECLREISTLLPLGVDLTSYSYKKYATVSLRGEALSSDPIYDFFQRLEASGLFHEVKPEGVTDEVRGGRQRSQFRVTLALPAEEES